MFGIFDLENYHFTLPNELIAQTPLSSRDASRLLVVDRKSGKITHTMFNRILDHVPSRAMFVANNSKVIRARLMGHRILPDETLGDGKLADIKLGGKVEFFLLTPKPELGENVWEGMFHASAKYVRGLRFSISSKNRHPNISKPPIGINDKADELQGELITNSTESAQGLVTAKFSKNPLEYGELPLPPYIERGVSAEDEERYQTFYAKELGSVAAPTAGLHFSAEIIQTLLKQGFSWQEITLHVGLGTFRPVKVQDIREHQMHEEKVWVNESVAAELNRARKMGRPLIAVGTTSLRTLESMFYLNKSLEQESFHSGAIETDIYFCPGVRSPKVVDHLVTNFHLPKSSLFLLVCSLGGTELIQRAYAEAIEKKYRFFSYGDAMLIL